jgi:hypothetical protein
MPESRVGGARKGAGRKPQGEVAMVTTAFVIRQDQRDWLWNRASQGCSRSEIVRYALDRLMADEPR